MGAGARGPRRPGIMGGLTRAQLVFVSAGAAAIIVGIPAYFVGRASAPSSEPVAVVTLPPTTAPTQTEEPESPTPSPSQASPPVVSPTAPTFSPSGGTLEDGRQFGYIHDVQPVQDGFAIVFDLAQFLTGDEADQAAREDGVIGPGEHVPNDYYIRNVNPLLRTVFAPADVQLKIVDWKHCCDTIDGDMALFVQSFRAGSAGPNYRGSASPYWLTVDGGDVTAIEEQYLP